VEVAVTPLGILVFVVATFWAMEWIAWASHRYLMHGCLWVLHRDHHRGPRGRLQRNDLFFVLFAVPSWLCIMLGMMHGSAASVSIGAGIALYGVAYFLVHEVFIHRRLRLWRDTKSVYWLAVRKSHLQHHRHVEREAGECFGMLWVERRFVDAARESLGRSAT
jgi:beta-carotene 3-hydroxylase